MEVFDYILVYAADEDELKAKLCELLKQLQAAGLTINRDKCVFPVDKMEFWGYHVTTTGLSPLPRKTRAITDFPPPKSAKALLRFLGTVNYYRWCLPNVNGKTTVEILQPPWLPQTKHPEINSSTNGKSLDWTQTTWRQDTSSSHKRYGAPSNWNYTGCNRQSLPA